MSTDRSPSLRRRLPLLILVVLAAIGLAFAWVAHREMELALRQHANERILFAAERLAELLGQSAAARLAEYRRLGQHPAVQRFVHTGEGAEAAAAAVRPSLSRASARATLHFIGPDGVPRGQIDRSSAGIQPVADASHEPMKRPTEGVGSFWLHEGQVHYLATAKVAAESGPADAPIGWLSVERTLAAAGVSVLENLIGTGALVRLGNASGDVWTDLTRPVDPPPVVASRGDAIRYKDAQGIHRLGNAVPVANTPWVVWIEFSESTVLQPARTLLRRMLPVTIVLIVLGALGVYVVSARMTKPLEELANAADAIAAGDYSRRVTAGSHAETRRLGTAFNVMAERVAEAHQTLEERVQARTVELEEAREELEERALELANANRELEAFSYSVSHDLRAPLRSIDGFAQALVEDYEPRLDDTGRQYLSRIRSAAQRMGTLIDDLLSLSRVSRLELVSTDVDLTSMAREIAARLHEQAPDRRVEWHIDSDLKAHGDARLLRIALENLLGNAWKFTSKRETASIELTTTTVAEGSTTAYVVRDNGAGFEMAYAGKLFGAFQRLHGMTEFPGTGIGLATVQRIVRRHGGRIWADATPERGASFTFTLESGPSR